MTDEDLAARARYEVLCLAAVVRLVLDFWNPLGRERDIQC